jgi:hypothetical protein
MSWLKRNLVLVVGGLIVLALLGGAGSFLWSQKQRADGVTVDLDGLITDLQTLTGRDPFPNADNIDATKVEQKRVADLLADCRRYFVPTSTHTNIDSATFKDVLETSIAEMEKDARQSGVGLPDKFHFTFRAQRGTTVFAAAELLPLTSQLADIKAICDVLFKARVHSIAGIRRVPVSTNDQGSTEFLTQFKVTTNTVTSAQVAPYEFTFQGFSGELASVLEGFTRSPHCLIVKNVNVEVATASTGSAEGEMPAPVYVPGVAAAEPTPQSAASRMASRYGLRTPMTGGGFRSPYGRGPGIPPPAAPVAPTPVAAPAAPRGPETVLDEKALKITILVDSVRLPLRVQ